MNVSVGQTIYLEPQGNAARRSKEIREAKVESVGRKFFTIEDGTKFFIENGRHNAGQYTSDWQAYESLQEIEYKNLSQRLHDAIKRQFFSGFTPNITLEDLKKISDILKIEY